MARARFGSWLLLLSAAGGGGAAFGAPAAFPVVTLPVVPVEPVPLATPSAAAAIPVRVDAAQLGGVARFEAPSFEVLSVHADPPRVLIGRAASDDAPLTSLALVAADGRVTPLGDVHGPPIEGEDLPVVVLDGHPPRIFRIADGAPVALEVRLHGEPYAGPWSVLPGPEGMPSLWIVARTPAGATLGRWDPAASTTVDLTVDEGPAPIVSAELDPTSGDVFVARLDGPGVCTLTRHPGQGAPECVSEILGVPEGYPGVLGRDRYLVSTDAGCAIVDRAAPSRAPLGEGLCARIQTAIDHVSVDVGGRRLWWDGATLRAVPLGTSTGTVSPSTAADPLGLTAEGRQLWLRHRGPAAFSGVAKWQGVVGRRLPEVVFATTAKHLVRVDLGAGSETPVAVAACAHGGPLSATTLRSGPWATLGCSEGDRYVVAPFGALATPLWVHGVVEPDTVVLSDAPFGRVARAHALYFLPVHP